MILSVSRRTDIPAFYSEWFFNRIKEGFVYVRNPMNIHVVSRIPLNPKVIDCIVFWSKNPAPMLPRLDELKDYMYYFQITINPYDKSFECEVPLKHGVIDTFRQLSQRIGPKRVIWRYDPILLSETMGQKYHVRYFEEICKRLAGYTDTCVISFVDLYKKTQKNLKGTTAREVTFSEMLELASSLIIIAQRYGIKIQTCAEEIALDEIGIVHGKCIDNVLIEDLLDAKIVVSKDPNQRDECGCVQSIDIGMYNTCSHGCKYCYANYDNVIVAKNRLFHNPNSPLLIGELRQDDKVVDREIFSFKKLPEDYRIGDFVRLTHPEKYKINRISISPVNVFKISSIMSDHMILEDIDACVPVNEIRPVGIDGKEDRWIYYDPVIAAPTLSFDAPIPEIHVDYSYYYDAFRKNFYRGKSYREIIEKKKLRYVHEVQHWLWNSMNDKGLKINESRR